jgi:hypothetical protein
LKDGKIDINKILNDSRRLTDIRLRKIIFVSWTPFFKSRDIA